MLHYPRLVQLFFVLEPATCRRMILIGGGEDLAGHLLVDEASWEEQLDSERPDRMLLPLFHHTLERARKDVVTEEVGVRRPVERAVERVAVSGGIGVSGDDALPKLSR